MIKYTRNADGTYTKTGGFEKEPTEVRIQVADGRPFSGGYTLAQATAIIEDGIAKNQVQKDSYTILPIESKTPKAEKAPKEPKAPKAPKEPKAAKEPKANKYSADDFVRIYNETKSLDAVVKQTGASRVWAQRVLVKHGVWVKPVRAVKPEVELTLEEETRVADIIATLAGQTELPATRQQAIKQLRKEQRIAARPPKTPKAPRVLKYSKDDFAVVYAKNHSLKEVCEATGASPVWAQRVLVRLGVWVKPVKAAVTPAPAPVVETPAPAPKAVKTPKAPKAAKPAAPKAEKKSKGTPAPADVPAAQ